MDKIKKCTLCNMKLDVVNYLKYRTVCKSCYEKNRGKSNNITPHHRQKTKVLITITREPSPDENQPRDRRTKKS